MATYKSPLELAKEFDTPEVKELLANQTKVKNYSDDKYNEIVDKIQYGRDNGQELGAIQDELLGSYSPDYHDLVRYALSKWAE